MKLSMGCALSLLALAAYGVPVTVAWFMLGWKMGVALTLVVVGTLFFGYALGNAASEIGREEQVKNDNN